MFAIINSPGIGGFDFLFAQSTWEARSWIEQKEKDAKMIHGEKWREVLKESKIVSDREFGHIVRGNIPNPQSNDEFLFYIS